ncbi:MAG: hypothetical protein ACE3L7_02105 [Candidatus Pristimantibacillus sp.]
MKRFLRSLMRSEMIIMLIAAVALLVLLFIEPIVGVANNGDFYRIMLAGGIDYADLKETAEERFFGYFHAEYGYGVYGFGSYISSQVLFVFVAGLIGRMLHSELFDIRVLSALYSVVLLVALCIIVKYNKSTSEHSQSLFLNTALVICLSLVFLDIGYLAYFNSFFGESITLLFMLLTFGLALANIKTEQPSRWLLIAFYISGLFLITTKLQNAPIGIIIILLGVRFWGIGQDLWWRRTILIGSSVLLISMIAMYIGAPSHLKQANLYQTVFFGILKDSPDPSRDLKEMGLPDEFKVNAGTNYFQKDTVIKQNDPRIVEELGKLSHKDVLLYYVKHPTRFVQKLERGAENGMSIRPYYLGSYEKSEGRPSGEISYMNSTWSEFKIAYMPKKLWFIALFYLVYVGILAVEYARQRLRGRLFIEALLAIALIGIIAMVVPLLGDGEADLGKHLFLFNVCFDMMIVVAVLYLCRKAWAGALGILKPRSPVTRG